MNLASSRFKFPIANYTLFWTFNSMCSCYAQFCAWEKNSVRLCYALFCVFWAFSDVFSLLWSFSLLLFKRVSLFELWPCVSVFNILLCLSTKDTMSSLHVLKNYVFYIMHDLFKISFADIRNDITDYIFIFFKSPF